jgi:antitoxin Phd
MIEKWKLQDAKNKFSEVVEKALKEPQIVTRHGKETVVVISFEEYKKLNKPNESLADFFKNSPLNNIKIERDKSFSREVDL